MASQNLSRAERAEQASGDTRSHRELCEANRHLHEFLAVLAHELRSPLAAIGNALRILEQDGDAAGRDWARSVMVRQTKRINLLVEDMLEVSRIEHGKVRLQAAPRFVANRGPAVETVRPSVEGRGHLLKVSLPPEPVALIADPNRLEQMLTNLLNNAAKYMEPGGQVSVTAQAEGDEIVLRVRDSGAGIDPEMLPHIFDPFWQVDGTLDRSDGGLGIGLALVRKLAEMHGGRASAHSDGLGCGSEFVVCLPAYSDIAENPG